MNPNFGNKDVHPVYTKTHITKTGKRLANEVETPEDLMVLENWRASHAYILKTFRTSLSRNIKQGEPKLDLATRLKRKNTIVDKLRTGRSKDLATMHDLAGCRLIFKTIDDLNRYRNRLHKSKFKHVRIGADKYNYIDTPKKTGYRGVHDVFRYFVKSAGGEKFNGLLMEIQYRTQVQHAWATAVEINDLINQTRIKFDSGVDLNKERFFVLASEYLARQHEGCSGALSDMTNEEIAKEIRVLEGETHIMQSLEAAHAKKVTLPKNKNIVLQFSRQKLTPWGFRSSSKALAKRAELEQDYPNDDVVYVRGENSKHIASAFRNYFKDASHFVELMTPVFR